MIHDPKTYLKDTRDNNINGVAIISKLDDSYRVAEHREDEWSDPFVAPAEEIEAEYLEPAVILNSSQYMEICQITKVSS